MEDKNTTPWALKRPQDLLLTLSNHQLELSCPSDKKQLVYDRYMKETSSIKCRLNFDMTSDNHQT